MPDHPPLPRPSPRARRHGLPVAVAAGQAETAAAGRRTLARGGTAVDAAVAMMLTACVSEQLFTGLGGGGFATVHSPDGTVRCVDFFVAVPGLDGRRPGPGVAITVSFAGHAVPYDIGAATVAVPGITAGAEHLWRRWGRLAWPEVVEPAIAQAELGSVFPAGHAALLGDVTEAMCVGEGGQVFCGRDGRPLRGGERVHHPALPHTLRTLAADPSSFRDGELAALTVAAVGAAGALSALDLASYEVIESEPVTVTLPRPDGGTWRAAARGDDLDDTLGTLAAMMAASDGDPVTDPRAAVALVEALRAPDRRTETTNLVAVDADGGACVITCSLGLGSGVWVPGTGVHLNSMLGEGELIRDELPAGARMGSMMSPLVVLDGASKLVLAAGAAGGSRIRSALVQTVPRMLRGTAPTAAIEAPRLAAPPGGVRAEPGIAPAVLDRLAELGEVHVTELPLPYFGGVSAIGTLGAGADPRRAGAVEVLDAPGWPVP